MDYSNGLHRLDSLLDSLAFASRLVCFVEGDDAGTGAGETTVPGTITPLASGTTQTPATGDVKPPAEDEVQTKINKGVGAVRHQLKQQYGGEPDEIKVKLERLAELERSQMTEAEKTKADLDAAKLEATQALAEASQLRIENALHKHLAASAELQPYLGKEMFILPQVEKELGTKKATPENISKAVVDAVTAFTKALPLTSTGDRQNPGTTQGPARSGIVRDDTPSLALNEVAGYLNSAGFTSNRR